MKIVNVVFEDDEWNELVTKKYELESWHDAILRWCSIKVDKKDVRDWGEK